MILVGTLKLPFVKMKLPHKLNSLTVSNYRSILKLKPPY